MFVIHCTKQGGERALQSRGRVEGLLQVGAHMKTLEQRIKRLERDQVINQILILALVAVNAVLIAIQVAMDRAG